MLFNLAKKNISKNFNNYFMYFMSVVFNVVIYFTFESMVYNKQVASFIEGDTRAVMVFRFASCIIAIFSAVFIGYSTSFFIKKRKKEIGMYSLLGLKKREIGSMLFYETLLMGVLALFAGIFIGALLCKLFIMALIKVVGVTMQIGFSLSINAVINTFVVFGILFLVVSISAYTVIYRFKLIELFKAEKVGEKEPKASITMAVLSIIILGIGYVLAIKVHDSPTFTRNLPITIACCIIGSFMFFKGFLIFLIKSFKNKKYLYYKGENMISISHLLYRIKANGRNLAVISLLNAAALTSIGLGYSLQYRFADIRANNFPFSVSYISSSKQLDEKVEDIFKSFKKENKVLYSAEGNFIKLNGDIDGKATFDELKDKNIYLISESQFNNIAKLRGLKDKVQLSSKNETILLKAGDDSLNKLKGKNMKIFNSKAADNLKILDRKEYDAMNTNQIGLTFLVKDEVYNKYYNNESIVKIKGYKVENEMDSKALSKALIKIIPEESKLTYVYEQFSIDAFISMILFIGIFLGLVFIVSTGSIIYFKQLTEATEDKDRYTILKKLGMSNLEVKNSIKKQVSVIFATPLIIGICHSLAAFGLISVIFGGAHIITPIIVTVVSYLVIYMAYYFLTVSSYNRVVNSD